MASVRTIDRDPVVSPASLFRRAKKLEKAYATHLRRIARHVGDIVAGFDPTSAEGAGAIRAALQRYASALQPWAAATGDRMVKEIAAADRESWRRTSMTIGRLLHKEIETAPTGGLLRASLQRQVALITSLPIEAAERVHKLTTEGIASGRRTSAIADDIMATGAVTRSRADLIARTEVSRTATELTKARAEHIGSKGYIWRTAHDRSVRSSHHAMEGRFVAWAEPPTLDGMTGHAGGFPNCRCYPEPVIANDDD